MTYNLLSNAAKLFGCTHMEDRSSDSGNVYFGYVVDQEYFVTLYRQADYSDELMEFDYRERIDRMRVQPEPIP